MAPMVNFVHDEIIFEFPEDEHLQYNCRHVNKIMIESMKIVIPDVLIATEGALMRRWYKEAEQLLDDAGNYQIWEPKPKIPRGIKSPEGNK
jgi:hypothetical protein